MSSIWGGVDIFWNSPLAVITSNPSIDFKEHSNLYFTLRPSYFDTCCEISVFPPYSSWKTIVWERIANFEQGVWGSSRLNYPDLLYVFVNMKLKIEFIFFCGVHTSEKILTLCGITCTKNYCFQPD